MRPRADFRKTTMNLARLVSVATCLALVGLAAPARSQESPYCRKVRARAGADAALLYAPAIQAQGIKFPNNGTIDSGATAGAGYQFRASASFSPLGFYKGTRVERAGERDCEQHEALLGVQDVLAQASDVGRLAALRAQVALLESRRTAWEAIAAKSSERFEARVTSMLSVSEIRSRVAELERRQIQVSGEISRLEARGAEADGRALSALVERAEKDAMAFERELSHVRSLDAWDVKVSGGVIPQDRPVDFFAMVHLGFSFGSFSHNAHESRYLEARADELKTARYELRDQVRRFQTQLRLAAGQAKRELAVVDAQIASLTSARTVLERSEASGAPHSLALVDLDLVFAESERTFLSTLINQLSRFQENDK